METKILLADDYQYVRSALQLLLEQEEGLSVISGVGNSEELWETVKESCPDLLLIDWELPGNTGENMVKEIRENCSRLIIIVLSSRPEVRKTALNAGADGFISKGSSPREVIMAVRRYRNFDGKG